MAREAKHLSSGEIVIVGGGPAGLVTAVLLGSAGVPVRLFAPPSDPNDTRTTALLRGSVDMLKAAGVWESLAGVAAPLEVMRIVDATGRLLRAPEISFDSNEIGGGPFGYNVKNSVLVEALEERAAGLRYVAVDRRKIVAVRPDTAAVRLEAEDGAIFTAAMVAAADGRRSLCRKAAGIDVSVGRYEQMALAFDIDHQVDHGNVSTEFHTDAGPLTFVPLGFQASSVVWVVRPDAARRLLALKDAAFCDELRETCFAILGDILNVGPRAAFPIGVQSASAMAARRIALIGEAGHVVPPIGAQGLNLGFRDAATLAEIVADAWRTGADPGDGEVLRAYAWRRRADVAARTAAVDLLNRSVLSGFLPLQAARGAGLYLLQRLGPLRRLVMELGIEPPGTAPRIMRGEPL
jgi:2-octaprenyl-6-methoxyphenol hydroxylase